MKTEWNAYADRSFLEETVGNILLDLPWETDERDELKDKILKLIDDYHGRQEETKLVCIHWLASSPMEHKVTKKFNSDGETIYKMLAIARYIMNTTILSKRH